MSSLPPEPRILVTGAGGPAAVSVLRALASRAQLFAVDIDPYAAGLHLAMDGNRAIVRRGDDPEFVDELLERCRDWRIDVLIPTVDCELVPVAEATTRFAALGTSVVVGPAEPLATCLDKWRLACCIESSLAPRTWLVDGSLNLDALESWPLIVKPRIGSGSRGVRLVNGPADLATGPFDGSLILQEFLPGDELSVDVYVAADHRPIGAVPRQRLRVDSGVSIAGRTLHDPEAIGLALDVVASLGLTGPANVQCRRDAEGRLRLLEVNPRFPGSLPLTIRSGFDVPAVALDEALGGHPRPLTSFDEIAVVRHLDEIVVSGDALAALERAAHPMVGVS